jgi:hypothetical protein
MAYDPNKADVYNELRTQYPGASESELQRRSGIPASESGNYSTNATGPAQQIGQLQKADAAAPRYDWSDVTSDDTNLDAYGDTYQAAEPLPPAYERPPVPEPAVEPANPGPTATELSREYVTDNTEDLNAQATETTANAEDYSVVEPNPVGYERPGLQDDGTIVLDDGDDVNFTDNARDHGSDFDEEDDIDFAADRVEAGDEDGDTIAGGTDYGIDDDEAEDAAEQDAADAEAQEAANQAQALKQQAQQQQRSEERRGRKGSTSRWSP